MKKCCLIITSMLYVVYCNAQRYDSKRLYDWGLPDSKELTDSLSVAIPCLIIGFIICWITMWGKPHTENGSTEKVSYIGCGGCLIMAVGGFFLMPLLAYVELAGMTLFYVFLIVAIILGVFYWLKEKL